MDSEYALFNLRMQSKAYNENGIYGVSRSKCESESEHIVKSLKDFEQNTGYSVVFDAESFWKKRNLWSDNTIYRYYKFGDYLGKEDGYCEPYRTGNEVKLYNNIKNWIVNRKPGESLSMEEMLKMGLKSCVEQNNKVNVQEALLTIHNVVRLLARPTQWSNDVEGDFGHPKTDPVYPILQDIRGVESTEGKSIAELMFNKNGRYSSSMRAEHVNDWTNDLFAKGEGGIFEMREGTEYAAKSMGANNPKACAGAEAKWNGGCHYYYWMGALARTTMNQLSVIYGGTNEEELKLNESYQVKGTDLQGITEVSHLYCGAALGSELEKRNKDITSETINVEPVKTENQPETSKISDFTGIYASINTYRGNSESEIQITHKSKTINIKMLNSGKSQFINIYGTLAEVEPELDYTNEFKGKLVYVYADDNSKTGYSLETIIILSTADSRQYGSMRILVKGSINGWYQGKPDGPPDNDWKNLFYEKKK
ncbi:MAG: hypothetical protein WC223_02930 [Bacteroidales bacterium]|jgi:hypothetical protein